MFDPEIQNVLKISSYYRTPPRAAGMYSILNILSSYYRTPPRLLECTLYSISLVPITELPPGCWNVLYTQYP